MRHHQRITRKRNEKATLLREEFGEDGKVSDDGITCTMAATHYFVEGKLGIPRYG